MRIVQINHFSYKAAGHIMMNIHRELLKNNIDSYVVWGRGRKAQNEHEYYMGDPSGVRLHAAYTRLTDRTGFASKHATKRLLSWLDGIKPDIIHLHCIHGYYINIEMLFDYIRANSIRVIWTQHDCWSFTGHCAYFDMAGCEKWTTGCSKCTQLRTYPASYRDASEKNWNDKKRLFTGLNITLVTPCVWLRDVIGRSFLSEYPVRVIYNGIDTDVFHPTENQFRKQHSIGEKYLILGVAGEWTERKGLKDIIELDKRLDKNKYQIAIVGLTKKQLSQMPDSIIAMTRTESAAQLADIYSSADIFFNPTYEDNFPTTNLEALACGTPVLTYNTGGSPESVESGSGAVVPKGDIEKSMTIMEEFRKNNKKITPAFDKDKFSVSAMLNNYLELYNE